MSLDTQLQNLSTRVSTQIKLLNTLINGNVVNLSALSTSAKSNLVAAINELDADIQTLSAALGAKIDDGATAATTTWSSSKIDTAIAAKIAQLTGAAPAALDTIFELAAALQAEQSATGAINAALAQRVSVLAQSFSAPEQAQARANIGAVAASEIGATNTDYVQIFETGLT
jgi:hypothetical protein